MGRAGGKSGRCMAGAPNIAAPTHEPFLVVTLDGAKARLLVGLAAFVSWTNLLVWRGSARHRNLWRRVVRDPFFVAACVLAATGLTLQRSGPAPANGLPRKGGTFRVVGAASWPPLPCSGRPAPWAGVALSALATSNGPGMWLLATVLRQAPAVSSPSSPWPGDRSSPFSTCRGDSRGAVRGALRAMGSLRGCGGSWGRWPRGARSPDVAAAVVVVLARVR